MRRPKVDRSHAGKGHSIERWSAGSVKAVLIAILIGSPPLGGQDEASSLAVTDIFGRRVDDRSLILVDLEGPFAIPAARIRVRPPADAAFPAKVVLTTATPRLYFDLPSEVGPRGSRKEFTSSLKDDPGRALISVWGDRDGRDEDHVVAFRFTDATGREWTARLPVHVIDQDRDRPPSFPIAVDFGQDRTGFFRDAERRRVVEEAASDWAYFLEGGGLEPVRSGAEATWIWKADGFREGAPIRNNSAYTGFLLYAYGIHTAELRSGGEPSREGGWLRVDGRDLPLRRSGGLEIETNGNFNELGWLVRIDAEEWWRATNLADVPNDLLSIAHHEVGHSLFFNPANPDFAEAKRRGRIVEGRVRACLGRDPEIDEHDHFPGAVDPISRKGSSETSTSGMYPEVDVSSPSWISSSSRPSAIGCATRPPSGHWPSQIRRFLPGRSTGPTERSSGAAAGSPRTTGGSWEGPSPRA
jgi:hypothetical protein